MSGIPSTVCPFCNLGCVLGFELQNGEVRKVAYVKDSQNEGRLCPKGNAAALFINHPKRLYNAIIKGKMASLTQGIEFLRHRLSDYKPEEILFLYDSSLTNEEVDALANWCSASGFKNVAYAGLSSAKVFNYGPARTLSVENITGADYAIIVGDPYSQDSVISGYLAKAKGDRRDFRYVVVDSFETNTSHFAHRFIRVKAGYEGLFMYGLWQFMAGKDKDKDTSPIVDTLGVDVTAFESVAAIIRNKEGVIINAPSPAGSFDPLLTHAASLKLVSTVEGMTYVPMGERGPGGLDKSFFSYLPLLVGGRIKAIVSFAPGFPWGYTQLRPVLRKAEFVAASSFFIPEGRFEFDLVMPMASELEKKGTINTLFGKKELSASVPRISGTLSAGQYIDRISGSPLAKTVEWGLNYDAIEDFDVESRAKALIDMAGQKPRKGMKYLLLGSGSAIGFLSLFENEDWVKLNPLDALSLGVKDGDSVGIETEQGEIALKALISEGITQGTALVSANYQPSLACFELGSDSVTGEGFLKPTWSRLWKK